MVVMSNSVVVEALPVASNLVLLPSVPARSLSLMAGEGISLSILMSVIVSACPTFGDGWSQLDDFG